MCSAQYWGLTRRVQPFCQHPWKARPPNQPTEKTKDTAPNQQYQASSTAWPCMHPSGDEREETKFSIGEVDDQRDQFQACQQQYWACLYHLFQALCLTTHHSRGWYLRQPIWDQKMRWGLWKPSNSNSSRRKQERSEQSIVSLKLYHSKAQSRDTARNRTTNTPCDASNS